MPLVTHPGDQRSIPAVAALCVAAGVTMWTGSCSSEDLTANQNAAIPHDGSQSSDVVNTGAGGSDAADGSGLDVVREPDGSGLDVVREPDGSGLDVVREPDPRCLLASAGGAEISVASSAAPDAGNPDDSSLTGRVVSSSTDEITVDPCEQDAGCTAPTWTIRAVAAGLTLSIPPGTDIAIRFTERSSLVGSGCFGSLRQLVVVDRDGSLPDGAPGTAIPWLIVNVTACSGVSSRNSPFTVQGVGAGWGCLEKAECRVSSVKGIRFSANAPWLGSSLELGQGETNLWQLSKDGQPWKFMVRNLTSYVDTHDGTPQCADISGLWVYWIESSGSVTRAADHVTPSRARVSAHRESFA